MLFGRVAAGYVFLAVYSGLLKAEVSTSNSDSSSAVRTISLSNFPISAVVS